MSPKSRLLPLLLILLLTPFLMADVGPKPTADFTIEYEIEPIPDLVSASLFECDDPDCNSSTLLEELGPQHFECSQYACSSMAYGYSDYMKIELSFSDGLTRTSNIFTKKHFTSEYLITVRANDLLVRESGGSGNPLFTLFYSIIAAVCCLGLVIVGTIVLIIRRVRQKRKAEHEILEAA